MLIESLKSLIPTSTNTSHNDIIEDTLEAERLLNIKAPRDKNYNQGCRQACCLEHVLRKKVNDSSIGLDIFAKYIGMDVKKFKIQHKKLGFYLDEIVQITPTTNSFNRGTSSSSIDEDGLLKELCMKFVLGDTTSIIRETKTSISNIKKAMKLDNHKSKDNLAHWERNKIRYVCACFYVIAESYCKNEELTKNHMYKTQKILESDFDDAVDFVKKWLQEVDCMAQERNNKRKMNIDGITSNEHASVKAKKDEIQFANDEQSSTSTSHTSITRSIKKDSETHMVDDTCKARKEEEELKIKQAAKERYLIRKREILDKAIAEMRAKHNDELEEYEALDLAAEELFNSRMLSFD